MTDIIELMKPTSKLPPCDPNIYENGICVAIIAGGSAKLIDRFVSELREHSGEPVDWHYAAGRGIVLTTGDRAKVWDSIRSIQLQIQIHMF